MASRKKTAREKMLTPPAPEIIKNAEPRGLWPAGKMLISTPVEIAEVIRTVRKGSTISTDQIREKLAAAHKADFTCPLTTGIFVNIVAAAAEEDRNEGAKRITPYWRVVKRGGELNEKFPGGLEGHKAMLEEEGHEVVQRGKRMFLAR